MPINDWLYRMSSAIRTGFRAGWEAFQEQNYAPLSDSVYDDYRVRLARYWFYELYATNTIFTELETYRQQHKNSRNLYRHIRSIYNPVSRLIDLEVSKVYGGNIDYSNDLAGGAIPIVGAEPVLIEAIKQLFMWSNMGRGKNRFVRTGATYGDSAFKVVDDLEAGKVRLEVLDPRKIADVSVDAVGNVKAIRIEYMRYDPETKRDYRYTELIDGEWFQTFRDDQPYAYYIDQDGQPVARWANEYGFVPVRMCGHKEAGDLKFAATSFSTSLAIIDEMNDLASTIHDAIRRNVNPPFALAGDFKIAAGGNKITSGAEERDEQPFLKLPPGTTVTPMVQPLDIAAAMLALTDQMKEVEKNMPQLAIQRIREAGGNLSGVAVRSMYSDASDAIIATQGNYDAAMVAAVQMAVSIGGFRRYANFTAFNLDSYARGDLEFTIAERPVFPDEISKTEKMNIVLQAADSPAMRLILKELDYSDEQIDEVEANVQGREAAAVRGLAAASFGSADPDEDEDEDVIDAETTDVNQPAQLMSGQPNG